METPEFIDTTDIPLPDDTEELFNKLRVYKGMQVLEKIPYHKLSTVGYLWASDPLQDKDAIDDEFEAHPENFTECCVYGYHTYGGFYGFFRPSLDEVIKLGQDIIRAPDVKIVYVTTVCCDPRGHPVDSVSKVYDSSLDMHRAKTVFKFKRA